MRRRICRAAVIAVAAAALAGCGGGGSSGGTATGSGTTTPPITPAPTPTPTPPAVTGSAELTWTTPTLNEDGTPLTNLAGYKVHYGQSAGALTKALDVPTPSTTTAKIDGLQAGTWYFSLTSYTNTGVESAPTGVVWKTIQ
jgi:hypothetical protein